MAYRIERTQDLIEVHLWGKTHAWEVITILGKLSAMTPRKDISDLWTVAEESIVPWDSFATIVSAIAGLLPASPAARRSAIVVQSALQKAQVDLYVQEARRLPFETGAFTSRDEALAWLRA